MHKGTWLQSQFVFHNGFRGIIENISFGCFTTLRRTTTTSHCRAPVAGTHKWKFQSANFSVHMSVHVFTLAHYRGELWLFHSVWLNAFYVHVRMRSMHYRMGCDRAIGMCIVVVIASAMVVDFSRCRSSFRRIFFFFLCRLFNAHDLLTAHLVKNRRNLKFSSLALCACSNNRDVYGLRRFLSCLCVVDVLIHNLLVEDHKTYYRTFIALLLRMIIVSCSTSS